MSYSPLNFRQADPFWQPLPTIEASPYDHIPWCQQPAGASAGCSNGDITESQVGGSRDASLLDNSYNFPETLGVRLLGLAMYEIPACGGLYSDTANNPEG